MKLTELSFEEFIAEYPIEIRENATLSREMILRMFGQAEEVFDSKAKIIGYTFGRGYKDTLCTLMLSQKSLKIGFNNGSLINDPECVLKGSGNVHRFAVVRDFYAQQSYLQYLLKEAFKLWKLR